MDSGFSSSEPESSEDEAPTSTSRISSPSSCCSRFLLMLDSTFSSCFLSFSAFCCCLSSSASRFSTSFLTSPLWVLIAASLASTRALVGKLRRRSSIQRAMSVGLHRSGKITQRKTPEKEGERIGLLGGICTYHFIQLLLFVLVVFVGLIPGC